jgi:carbonic anhydrase/acetyltransferase-like protein (isoleucine patch superfamily)
MIRPFRGRMPTIAASAYIDQSAQVIGDVQIGERASVWCNATVRGDVNSIRIGNETNVQDNCCLHVDGDKPLELGTGVVVAHSATVHACIVEADCLIGMGATILSGARIGSGSIVAAGSVVTEGQQIPPRSMVMGVPAKVRRSTSDEEVESIRRNAQRYVERGKIYLAES